MCQARSDPARLPSDQGLGLRGITPGLTIVAQRGRNVAVRYINELPRVKRENSEGATTSVHLHGNTSTPQYYGMTHVKLCLYTGFMLTVPVTLPGTTSCCPSTSKSCSIETHNTSMRRSPTTTICRS